MRTKLTAPPSDVNPAASEFIPFHGHQLQAVRDGERVWVSIRRVCETFSIDHSTQHAKLKEAAWSTVGQCPMVAADDKIRETSCIDLDALPMWLATIDLGRVRPELRELLREYQVGAAKAVRDWFFKQQAPAPPEPVSAPALAPPASLARSRPSGDVARRIAAAEDALRDLEIRVRLAEEIPSLVFKKEFCEPTHAVFSLCYTLVDQLARTPGIEARGRFLLERANRLQWAFTATGFSKVGGVPVEIYREHGLLSKGGVS